MRSKSRVCLVALSALVGASGVASLTSRALACGENPTPQRSFVAATDAATSQATDAPVVLALRCSLEGEWSQTVRDAACSGPGAASARVTVKPAAGGAEVVGSVLVTARAVVFLPSAPLLDNTEYSVEAQLQTGEDASSVQTTRAVIRTTGARLAAFESAQPPSVTPEWYDAPVAQCGDARLVGAAAVEVLTGPFPICPSHFNCVATGNERTLRLHAKLGPFLGGASAYPFTTQVQVASTAPVPFEQSGFAPVDATAAGTGTLVGTRTAESVNGGSVDLYFDLTAPTDLKTPLCVRARAFDITGKLIELPARCRTYVQWMTDASWPDEAGGDEHETAISSDGGTPAAQPADSSKGDDGCSALPGQRATSTGMLTMLIACAAVLRRRRARH